MAAVFQTTFLNGFSWIKIYEFRLKFLWSLFLGAQLTIYQHWFRKWLGADQATSHYLNQWWLIYWRIYASLGLIELTHWGRVMHTCVSKLTIIGADNGLSPGRHQAIIWTNAGILLIEPLSKNLSEIFIEIHIFSFKKMHLKMSSGKCQPFCLSLIVLRYKPIYTMKPVGSQPTYRYGCQMHFMKWMQDTYAA